MTYSQLLELIEEMSEEQKGMAVTVSCEGAWHIAQAMTQLTFIKGSDDPEMEQFPLGQPILEV